MGHKPEPPQPGHGLPKPAMPPKPVKTVNDSGTDPGNTKDPGKP